MKERRSEKLTEWFVGLYKVKSIILANAVELELPPTIKIDSIVNVSRLQPYKPQVEEQRATLPVPVIVEGEEKYDVMIHLGQAF